MSRDAVVVLYSGWIDVKFTGGFQLPNVRLLICLQWKRFFLSGF